MQTRVKTLEELLVPGETRPSAEWQARAIQSEECLSYVVWNTRTKEAIVIDPKDEDREAYHSIAQELKGYLWLAVIDTHTHADHISIAAQLADELKAPLVMHSSAPSPRVHIRVAKEVGLPSHAAPVSVIPTPGHTLDSITPIWGPFIFGGDTVLFGDSGRDDLPGGDATAHYESLVSLKERAKPEMILLPGHDHRGGRASSWATQLKLNASLNQSREV
ncbi:MBL fold metallo-hydrolase, partial [bacterium]|nr:MBL fold metallo-hydrolase [bacterium]